MRLEEAPCPLGCEPGDDPVVAGRDRLHDLPGTFTVVRCRTCELARTNPRPTPDTIGEYYPDDYGPYVGTRVESAAPPTGLRGKLVGAVKRITNTKAHALPERSVGRMLEVGCASGAFLHEMAQQGWEVEGIEFSPKAAAMARDLGYSVASGAIEEIEKAEAQYDLVVGWMVMEHLHDPVGSLRKLSRWAKPGAQLAVSVPDHGAAEARLFGKRWYALQLPTHLFHYDADSIRKVMEAGGWRVTRIIRHRNLSNLIASLGYWFTDRGWTKVGHALETFPERGGRIGAGVLFPFAWMMAKMGQTGRMTVWAERLPA